MARTSTDERDRENLPRGRHAAHAREDAPCCEGAPRHERDPHEGLVRRRHKRRNRRARRVAVVAAIALIALVVAIGAAGGALASSAKTLKNDGQCALLAIDAVQKAVVEGDFESARASSEALAQAADRMAGEIRIPLWTVAGALPIVGEDVRGARVMVGVLQDASANALVPLVSALESQTSASLIDDEGSFDLSVLDELLASVSSCAPVMQRCADEMSRLPTFRIEQLGAVAATAQANVAALNDAFQQVSSFALIADAVLGGSGQRTYLIMAQNTAELRAAGGFPGSVGIMTVDDGKIELGDFSSVSRILDWNAPESAAITAVETELFEGHMSSSWDACFNPDFPRCASIWAQAYYDKTGSAVDGVLSLTPAVVQRILSIAGPVTLADGTVLDGASATKSLQHDLYWKYLAGTAGAAADETANALFAQAASLSFDAMLDSLSSDTLLRYAAVLADSIESREFMFWLADADEQEKLAKTGCAGELPSDPAKPEVGVFANIWLASKMGWYFDISTTVGEGVRNADGTTSYQVTTRFANAATAEEAQRGGAYLMGLYPGYEMGDIAPFIYFYAPCGGSISNLQTQGDAGVFVSADYQGRQVVYSKWTRLLPGDEIQCAYTVTVPAGAEEPLSVMTMPTLTQYRN